jgi:uncharacterized Zn finger protein
MEPSYCPKCGQFNELRQVYFFHCENAFHACENCCLIFQITTEDEEVRFALRNTQMEQTVLAVGSRSLDTSQRRD